MSYVAEVKEKKYYKWIVLANVAIGTFMATLDGSIVNVALPTIGKVFEVDKGTLQWAVTGYLLTISALLLAFGRMADIVGKNRVYAAGFLGFVIGSALCASATGVFQLVVFRVIQAVGAAMLMANAMGLVTSVFPSSERGRALGITGTVVALGSLTGPALGGFLVGNLGWRSIFYVNIPIGIAGFIVSVMLLPKDKDIAQKQKFDYFGAFLFGSAMTLFLTGLSEGQDLGWTSARVLGELLLSVVLFSLFFVMESRVEQPMIDFSLFRNRFFFTGNIAGLLSFVSMFFITYLLPFYMAEVLRFSPYKMGLVMTSFPLVMALAAPFSGWLSDRFGPILLTTGGLLIKSLGLFLLANVSPQTTAFSLAWKLGLMGLGSGLFQSPNNSSIMGTVPLPKLGIAGGVVATVRNVGMVMGVAISVSIFNTALSGMKNLYPYREAYVKSLSTVIITAALIALTGAVVSLVRGSDKSRS